MWHTLIVCCAKLGFAWARRRLDDEARDELDAHLDLLVERYIQSGMTAEAAHRAARRRLGNVALVREEIHHSNGLAWADTIGRDVRYAIRQLRRGPVFAAVVMATLGLGLGGTTAVFSVVQAVLMEPLPFEEPDQLVRFYQQEPENVATRYYLTGIHFRTLREHAVSFSEVAALDTYAETGLDLVRDGRTQRVHVLQVTKDYFRALRAGPLRGPGFDLADESGSRRVVLSDAVWQARFGSDPTVVGTTIQLSAESYEVVGIAAPGFEDPIVGPVDAWLPYGLVRNTSEENYSLTAVGRLRAGVTLEQARAELTALSQSMKARWPATRRSAVVALPLKDDLVAGSRGPLKLLLIAAALMLLVACVNVANLMLVRATARGQEFAIRSALGSGRRRLVCQLLVESVLLSALGGLAGMALAWYGVSVLRAMGTNALPRVEDVGFNGTVFAFSTIVTAVTAVVCTVAPAFNLAGTSANHALRQQSRSATGTRRQGRLRSGLAAAQLALALTLLAGAGVLFASFYRLQRVDLGFRVDRVLSFTVNLPTVRYDAQRRSGFQEELARRISAIPGVIAAGGTSRLPATGSYHPWGTRIETGPLAGTMVSSSRGFTIQQRVISGEFFRALDIPVLAGRTFDARDTAASSSSAVVSLSFARQAFPDVPLDSVVGQRIAPLVTQRREVIGVVGDVTLDVYGTPALTVYHAHRQFAGNRNWALTQVVSTSVPPDRILAAVRAEVVALDPELVVHRALPLTEVIGRGVSRQRFALVLMAAFAAVSLTLAAIGLYGVLAYTVRQRTQEIGIRMALGATAAQVRTLVLRQAAVALALGLIAGLAGALVLGRWLSSLLFETSPWDPRILAATVVLLTIVGLISAWLPARRAARVEPRSAMQEG